MPLNPQIVQQLVQGLMARKGATNGNAPISFANSGGARPPMGVSGGAGGGVGVQNMNGGGSVGTGVGGGGPRGTSFPGGGYVDANLASGTTPGQNAAFLGSEGALQAGKAGFMGVPQNRNTNPSASVLTDLTSGVGPPLGTSYSTPTQGDMSNPGGPVGVPVGAFDTSDSIGGGSPTTVAPQKGAASFGRDLDNLIQPGDKSHMGRTIPKRAPSLMDSIFPQTGLQPYRGPLG